MDKALEQLLSEFYDIKYAEFVRDELNMLLSGKKELMSFQSEDDEVKLDVSLKTAKIEYDYWDEKRNDFISGMGGMEAQVVILKIKKILQSVLKGEE
ncbi:hypothetical protein [Gallaecimonas sp. GXIMD4217]|uniref:hypothetical protein n=1 Tax=Gallaecimonas sp. GXIMD4217 TaxID=3131927 RepID=UPI00311AE86D